MGCGGHGAQARCWLRRGTTWKHGNDGITRQKAFLAAPLHPTLPHYRELPQHPHRGALGCSAHQLICSTLSHQVPAHLPLPHKIIPLRAQNYSFPCGVAMELVAMAAKGLANIYSHNRPMDSWKIVFLALQLETRVTAAPQQTGQVHGARAALSEPRGWRGQL